MINAAKSHKAITDILSNPANSSISLSNEKTIAILIETLQAYKKHEITLTALTGLAAEIAQKSTSLTKDVKNIASEIKSFSIIEEVLNDMLTELKEKRTK